MDAPATSTVAAATHTRDARSPPNDGLHCGIMAVLQASTSAAGKRPLEIDHRDSSAAVKRRRIGGAGRHVAAPQGPTSTDAAPLLAALEARGAKVVVVATGGGTQAISHLLSTPGASGVVLECLVPYARAAVD
ncbi:MAG: hypothetical protein EBX36_00165, partial [Planctomycetia bacterium]|nr:hypothetical protein [Planctomycetia bacterium]